MVRGRFSWCTKSPIFKVLIPFSLLHFLQYEEVHAVETITFCLPAIKRGDRLTDGEEGSIRGESRSIV